MGNPLLCHWSLFRSSSHGLLFLSLRFPLSSAPPRCEQSACVSRIIVPRSFLSRFAFLCRVSGCCLGCQIHPTVTQNRPSLTARLGSWQALLPQTSSLAFTGPPCWDSQPQACRVSSQTVLFSWGCSTVFSPVPKPSPWPPCFPMSLQLPTLFNLCHSEGLLGLVVWDRMHLYRFLRSWNSLVNCLLLAFIPFLVGHFFLFLFLSYFAFEVLLWNSGWFQPQFSPSSATRGLRVSCFSSCWREAPFCMLCTLTLDPLYMANFVSLFKRCFKELQWYFPIFSPESFMAEFYI